MNVESILIWVVLGGIAGWLAGMIMRVRAGLVATIVIGIVGAVVGGALVELSGIGRVPDGLNLTSIGVSVIGAVVFIALVRALRRI